MVRWVMVLRAVITPVLGASVPVETELALSFEAVNPVEAGVHSLHIILDDGVVDHAIGSGVVSLDKEDWL